MWSSPGRGLMYHDAISSLSRGGHVLGFGGSVWVDPISALVPNWYQVTTIVLASMKTLGMMMTMTIMGLTKEMLQILIIFVGLGPKGARQAFLFHCNTWTETFFYRQKRAYLISQELLLNCSPWNIGRITLEVVVVALIRKTVIDWDHTLLWGFACFFQTGIEG